MSTIIMSQCWPLGGMSPAQKSVLISLADNANDEGVCWPSIATVAMRTCLSERAVQVALRWLLEQGAIALKERTGRSTLYRVTPAAYAPPQDMHPRSKCTPADPAPTPAATAPSPPQILHPGGADAAPRTVKEPKREPSGKEAPPAAPSASSQDTVKGTRLPRDWALPKALGDWAQQERPELTADQIRKMGEKFKDHWLAQPGKDGRKTDWPATWRNWVRNERSVPVRGAVPGQPAVASGLAWATTWSGIVAKGAELGIEQQPNEIAPAFKARVMAAANLSDEEKARLRSDHGVQA